MSNNPLGTGAAVLDRGTEGAIDGATVPSANRQEAQRDARGGSPSDQLRSGVDVSVANLELMMSAAESRFQAQMSMYKADMSDGKMDGAVKGDPSTIQYQQQLIGSYEGIIAQTEKNAASINEARLNPQPIIINGIQPGDMGYNSYGLANGFMPMGAYNPFTQAGAPMMPQQMAGPQLRAKPDGSFEIVGPDGSIVHNYTNAELSGQLTPQEIAQFGLSPAQQESTKQFEEQREKARQEIEKAVSDLQGANASNLSDEQKQALLKQASDAQVRYNEATKQLNSIQGVNPNRPASFSLDNARDQREHAQRSEAQNIKFYQDWLKDEREFNQKRVQEYERMQRDLHQGDHEMLRRVAQRQMEQDIRNNAGWVRTYQQVYLQTQRAQIRDWTAEQNFGRQQAGLDARFARNEMAQYNRVVRKNFWENALEAASQTFIGGLFSRLTGSLFGDKILRGQNRGYDRVVRSDQQIAYRRARQDNRRGSGGALWGN